MLKYIKSTDALHNYTLDGTKILRESWTEHYTSMGNVVSTDYYIEPIYDNEDSVAGINFCGDVYFFNKNLQGDIIEIVSGFSGKTVAKYSYDAWGKCTVDSDSINTLIAERNPFRYRGYYYDAETDLYYLQSRYYDANTGRFVNSDAVEFAVAEQSPLSHNLFAYCGNDAINFTDDIGTRKAKVQKKTASLIKCLIYAQKWWNSRNPDFTYSATSSGDCANFVSQCLFASGIYQNLTWYYFRAYYLILGWVKIKVSNAWGNAHGLYSYLKKLSKNKKSVQSYTTITSIKKLNDVIKKGNYGKGCVAFHMKKDKPNTAGHAMLVGNVTTNNIFFWAHSSNRNGLNTGKSSYGFKNMLEKDPNRQITIFKINYNYTEWN